VKVVYKLKDVIHKPIMTLNYRQARDTKMQVFKTKPVLVYVSIQNSHNSKSNSIYSGRSANHCH